MEGDKLSWIPSMARAFPTTVAALAIVICATGQDNVIRIAAASNLKFAMDSLIQVFEKTNPGKVTVSYGSSGKLFEQVSHDAPFDIFFSADMRLPALLTQKGIAITEVHKYATGRIVLWSKRIDVRAKGMQSLLSPQVRKISIANPLHAPYGQRAEEALRYYKIFDAVETKLVYGQNISQTAQFVTSGAADVGIIALSLALSPNVQREKGHYFLIDQNSHQPLEQGFVLTRHAKGNDLVASFADFVKDDAAVRILQYFGFMNQ